MTNTPTDLAAFLRAGAARPFEWGACDCCLWVCDWVRDVRGEDPAADLRGRYRTLIGAARHLACAGGLSRLAEGHFAAAGLAPTVEPRPGDVAVVDMVPGYPALAIRTPTGWAVKSEKGISVMPYRVLKAWRV